MVRGQRIFGLSMWGKVWVSGALKADVLCERTIRRESAHNRLRERERRSSGIPSERQERAPLAGHPERLDDWAVVIRMSTLDFWEKRPCEQFAYSCCHSYVQHVRQTECSFRQRCTQLYANNAWNLVLKVGQSHSSSVRDKLMILRLRG